MILKRMRGCGCFAVGGGVEVPSWLEVGILVYGDRSRGGVDSQGSFRGR